MTTGRQDQRDDRTAGQAEPDGRGRTAGQADFDIPVTPGCKPCIERETSAHEVNCRLEFPKDKKAYKKCIECAVYLSCRFSRAPYNCSENENPRPKGCNSWEVLGTNLDEEIWPFPKR